MSSELLRYFLGCKPFLKTTRYFRIKAFKGFSVFQKETKNVIQYKTKTSFREVLVTIGAETSWVGN